jgi:hypothetical protein
VNIVLNGTFTDLSSVTLYQSSMAGANGSLRLIGSSASSLADLQCTGMKASATYRVQYTITDATDPSVRVTIGGTLGTTQSTTGTFTEDITTITGNNLLRFSGVTAPIDVSVDNVTAYMVVT